MKPFLVLIVIILIKFFEISYFDKDQNLDMAQIKGLDQHLKSTGDYFLPYPTKNGTYRWSVTGFGPLYFLQKYFSGNTIYFVFIALLFLTSFKVTLEISRSPPFAYLFSYLITLGYNYFIVFFDTRVLALILFLIYGLINFFCFYKLAVEKSKSSGVKVGFIISFILLIFCWDSWIDFGVAIIFISLIFKIDKKYYAPYIFAIPLYISVRFLLIGSISEITGAGREQDFIFNYGNWLLGVEDFSSNIIRYIHTAITNYFPLMPLNPLVINSSKPIDLINSFSPGATFQRDAIYYNYLYGWYLWAGITFSLYGLFLVKFLYKKKEKLSFILTSGLIFIFFGGFTHYFIKFRPLLVLPYNYSYRQFFSIVGITLLIAYFGDFLYKNKIRKKKTGITFIILICLCFTGMSWVKTKKAIDHSFIHNKLNPAR